MCMEQEVRLWEGESILLLDYDAQINISGGIFLGDVERQAGAQMRKQKRGQTKKLVLLTIVRFSRASC